MIVFIKVAGGGMVIISSITIRSGDIDRKAAKTPSFLLPMLHTSVLGPISFWGIPSTHAAISPLSSIIVTFNGEHRSP